MRLYSKARILKELVSSKHSISAIREVFSVCEFELELEFIASGFSDLSWAVTGRYVSGVLQAHVEVKISKDERMWQSRIPVFFQSHEETHEKAIEKELIYAVKIATERINLEEE